MFSNEQTSWNFVYNPNMTSIMLKDINQGDAITFKASDNKYKVLLCINTFRERSPHNFTFAALTYDNEIKPTIADIVNSGFYGIGNTKSEYFKFSDNDLDKMWSVHPEIKPYFLGAFGLIIWRKDFMEFKEHFELINRFQIIDHIDKHGNSSVNASDWLVLNKLFTISSDEFVDRHRQKIFKVSAILKTDQILP